MSKPLCQTWCSEKIVTGINVTGADRNQLESRLVEGLRAACTDLANNVSFVKKHFSLFLNIDTKSINSLSQETRLRLGLLDLTPLVDTRLSCEDFWKSIWPDHSSKIQVTNGLQKVSLFIPSAQTGLNYSINTAEPSVIHWVDSSRLSTAHLDFDSNSSTVITSKSSNKWIDYRNVFVDDGDTLDDVFLNKLMGPIARAGQSLVKRIDHISARHRSKFLFRLSNMLLDDAIKGYKSSVVFSINQAVYKRQQSSSMLSIHVGPGSPFIPEHLITTALIATTVTTSISSGRLLVPTYDSNFVGLETLRNLELVMWHLPYTLVDTVVPPPRIAPGARTTLFKVEPAKKFTIKDILRELDEEN